MCGIAGFVGEANNPAKQQAIRRMLRSLERRGPDSEGVQCWPDAILGHRRLSIFDLSDAGRQPMSLPGDEISVVFNGAIYNFPDLREELEQRGCHFRSQTDTEILLHGYQQWGIEALVERLRGMYAIGLWDAGARRCYLIRDRLGVKPLLYAQSGDGVAFASTAAALAAGGFAGELDPMAVAEYLEFGYVTDQRVIYQGLNKVAAGTVVELRPGQGVVRQWRYWKPPEASAAGAQVGFEEALERTENLFLEAVRLRLKADVPVGSLLSGGVDSGLVCWAVAKLGGQVTAFTVSTPGDTDDETDDASQTARELGISHKIIPMSAQAAPGELVDELCRAYGEPFGCSSALGMLLVSQAVRPHATVLLTGDGGDDVFLGYPEHKNFLLAQRIAGVLPEPLAAAWRAGGDIIPRKGLFKRPAHFMDYVAGGLGAVTQIHDGLPFYGEMLGPRLRGISLRQREIPWGRGKHVLEDFLPYDYQTRFPGEYLTKVDGGTMYHSLEARSPFLDSELWNYAASLPFAIRLHQGRSKALLREMAARRISPRVGQGRKRGFSIPAYHWMTTQWKAAVSEVFAQPVLAAEGWIDRAQLSAVWRQAQTGHSVPKQLWYLFVLESWLRHRL